MKITAENYETERTALYASFQNPQQQLAAFTRIALELDRYERSVYNYPSVLWLTNEENSPISASIYASLPAHDQADSAERHYLKGFCLYNGVGTAQNSEEAVKSFQTSAEQGFAPAQSNLGGYYFFGQGVTKNSVTAAEWWTKAAEQGLAVAQNNLGSCYEFGQGVTKDLVTAAKWYTKAAEQGTALAKEHLHNLQIDQLVVSALITAAIDDKPFYQQDSAEIDAMLTAFQQQQRYIAPSTLAYDGRLAKFTATLKRAIAPYQDDGLTTIEQNYPAIFKTLNESRAFASPESEQAMHTDGRKWAGLLELKTPLPSEIKQSILQFLGQCGENAKKLVEDATTAPLWSWAKEHFTKYGKESHMNGSTRLKATFNSEAARDAFQNHYNPPQLAELKKNSVMLEPKNKPEKNTWSVIIHSPPTLTDKNKKTLTDIDTNLSRILASKAPSHTARAEASSSSSSSSSRVTAG